MMLLLAISMVAGIKAGNASRYGYEGDVFDRVGSFACRRSLAARYGERGWQKMRDHGVAHRTLACGTRLGICNLRTNQCTTAYVVDRGPWGVLDRKGDWHVRTTALRPGEHFRGDLDLLPGTYSAIALMGIEKVAYWPIKEAEPARAHQRDHLPPLRAGGRSPFAVNLRSTTPEFPPLRIHDAQPATALALQVAAPVSASAATEPLFSQLYTSGELGPLGLSAEATAR
ncbi:MAG TPA: hypothetical protein PLW65_20440 [Pseudomonadota bacterium]|nr:hypothetical protein [Pseudomonadota bacterium]